LCADDREPGGAVPDEAGKLPGVDMTVANVARMWDYYLGGSENSEADREAARLVLGAAPDVPLAALENREFLKHAVRFLVTEAHISQFIDIGPGLPDFIRDQDDPYGCVAKLCSALCPGSYLVISHVTGEHRDQAMLGQIADVYDQATASLVMRTREEIGRFFSGFELVEPGLVFPSQWRPVTEYYAGGGTRWAYAGVGRKD
jgi:S-adenosyl methyltransferase